MVLISGRHGGGGPLYIDRLRKIIHTDSVQRAGFVNDRSPTLCWFCFPSAVMELLFDFHRLIVRLVVVHCKGIESAAQCCQARKLPSIVSSLSQPLSGRWWCDYWVVRSWMSWTVEETWFNYRGMRMQKEFEVGLGQRWAGMTTTMYKLFCDGIDKLGKRFLSDVTQGLLKAVSRK